VCVCVCVCVKERFYIYIILYIYIFWHNIISIYIIPPDDRIYLISRFPLLQGLGSVQRDSRLFDGVRWVVGNGPRAGKAVRWWRCTGYRQFRAKYAVGIPHFRVRQPVPSGAAQLLARIWIRRWGNYYIYRTIFFFYRTTLNILKSIDVFE
jgi:hypothetical protein